MTIRTIAFSLIGGAHQFLHGVPVAAALSHRSGIAVKIFVLDEADGNALSALLTALGAGAATVIVMRLPRWLEALLRKAGVPPALKSLRLVWWSRRIRRADCIVALERTSALLRRLPGRCPPLVQIPHGVGGARRAGGGGIDPRFSQFDLALVAGEADRHSTVEQKLLPADKVMVVGQVKLAGLRRMGKLEHRKLFANDRPTVFYNPHFHPRRGSWQRFGRDLIEAIGGEGSFNLIVAPHVRLFADESGETRRALESLGDPDWLIVDTGSPRSMDMTYTLAGDIYLGDFSSQLFEWLIHPRPCVFIDQLGDGGADDTKLPTMWSLGETVTSSDQILPALHRATARHGEYAARQAKVLHESIGDIERADELAAERIVELVDARG